MAKKTSATKLKGELDFDVSLEKFINLDGEEVEVLVLNSSTITEVTKEEEKTYDLVEILNDYTGKVVSFGVSEEKDLKPIE